MVRIILSNHKSRIAGDLKILTKLQRATKLKSPHYFFSQAWRERRWDGKINYVTDAGAFMTGMLPQILGLLQEWKVKYKIEDMRDTFKPTKSIDELAYLGGLEVRDYQLAAITAFVDNKIAGVYFRRGILSEATNAGKNLIAAGIFASFSDKRQGIFLIDNRTIFVQAVRELKQLLPDEVGQFGEKKYETNKRVTVCMVQSLASRCKKDPRIKTWLAKMDIFVADECDTVATRNDTKTVAQACYNASVRLGMSGTPLHHKDKTRNQEVLNFFGPVLHQTRNIDLVNMGVSSTPTIRFAVGNKTVKCPGNYAEEYLRGIIRNKGRNRRIWKIAGKAIKKGPVVILIKYHKHIDTLLKHMPDEIKGKYKIVSVHHQTEGRDKILGDFNKEKIDILIASMIIRRGINLKLMRSLINGAGGDSHSNVLQLLGRGLRKEAGKKEEIDIWDFFDIGTYLMRHSKHRIRYYKAEGFPIQELYK